MGNTKSDLLHDPTALPQHVGRKIRSIVELFAKVERRVGRHQVAIERMTDIVGRPITAYLIGLLVIGWMAANGLAPHLGVRAVDPPPFAWLQVAACVTALVMTVTILTTQNRIAKLAQQRAQLDLQVNLIAEEKIAKLVSLIEELRRDLPSVRHRRDSLASAMTEAVDLDAVEGKLVTIQEGGSQTSEPPQSLPPAGPESPWRPS
jgi:uncharacterized membrane protein